MTRTDSSETPEQPVMHLSASHDQFLTALVRNSKTNAPMSRIFMIKELRMTTGMDLRQCAAIVNDFCNHYGIFPKMPKWKLFLVMLPISIQLAVTLAFFIILMNQVHYNKTLLLVFWIVILLPNIINLALLPSRNRKTRRMAADAREKMGGLR